MYVIQFGYLLKSIVPCDVVVAPLHVLMVVPAPIYGMVGTHILNALSSLVTIDVSGLGNTLIDMMVVSHTPLLHTIIQPVSFPV